MRLDAIELDTSIQCRATIDTGVVNDYAERMGEGDEFPPVELYGTRSKAWIGDGWHRVMAARQRGDEHIAATIHAGGRAEALRHALGANALHGQRRSNADKRRAVEIALREFPKLSSRAIAKLCGVSPALVDTARPNELPESGSSKRTSLDGKERPARREATDLAPRVDPSSEPAVIPEPTERPKLGPPANGMQFARMAIMDLEQIREDDVEREQALAFVKGWIDAR